MVTVPKGSSKEKVTTQPPNTYESMNFIKRTRGWWMTWEVNPAFWFHSHDRCHFWFEKKNKDSDSTWPFHLWKGEKNTRFASKKNRGKTVKLYSTSNAKMTNIPGCHSWRRPFCFNTWWGSGTPRICKKSETLTTYIGKRYLISKQVALDNTSLIYQRRYGEKRLLNFFLWKKIYMKAKPGKELWS